MEAEMAKELKSGTKVEEAVLTDKKDVSDRQKALELALSHIEKQFGKGQ